MPEYRAYMVGHDGRFQKSVPLECADDDAARQQAEQLVDGHDVELWQLDRKIATFDHKQKIGGNAPDELPARVGAAAGTSPPDGSRSE